MHTAQQLTKGGEKLAFTVSLQGMADFKLTQTGFESDGVVQMCVMVLFVFLPLVSTVTLLYMFFFSLLKMLLCIA